MKARFVLALMVAALVAAGQPVHAANTERVEKARREVRTRQESALLNLLRDADEQRRAIEESLAKLERKINGLQDQLNQLRPALDQAKRDREQAEQAVLAAEGAYTLQRSRLGQNALSLYATGEWLDVFTIMGTRDLESFVSAQVYIDSVLDTNAKTVNTFRRSAEQLRNEQERVRRDTQSIIDRTSKIEREQQRLIKLSESKQKAANDLQSALIARTEALAAITNDPNGFELIVRSYTSGTNAVKLLVAAAQQGQPIEKAETGALWQPVQGRVSSGWGPRVHPIYKYKSFHTGIDIATDYGQPIRAARAGTIVDVVYLGAYGLVTVIDHGFSLATMYSHMARSLVHPGEQVQAGQVIGAVGCTGWCTGPHLHWEVWSRGQPQNPARWL